MGSGIEETDNMFSVKQRPWHGFGNVIENAPSIIEGIKLAKLDWNVHREPLYINEADGTQIQVANKRAIVRNIHNEQTNTDSKSILGVVSDSYVPLQNSEAFNFFEPFVENEMVTLETAGSLFSGKKVFILGKISGDYLEVDKDDCVEKYVLLSNSHDGSTAVRVGFTPIRVVCNNTLKMAHDSDASKLIRVRHTSQVQTNLIELRSIMDLVNLDFKTTVNNYKYLALRDINTADLKEYVTKVFNPKKLEKILDEYEDQQAEQEEIENERRRLLTRVEEIFELEPRKNLWTAYNSVQHYLQHDRGGDEQKRYNNLWFGNSDRINKKALDVALTF